MSSDEPTDKQPADRDLIKTLIDAQVISEAQAQLANADQEVTGMTMDEILLVRGWVNQSQLDQFAPWLKKTDSKPIDSARLPKGPVAYQDSLKEYRRLMEQILGTSWD